MATSNRRVSRPARDLAQSKRARYVNTGEASVMLDGLISAGILREMALRGEIPGALRVRQRVLIPRHVVPSLVTELEYQAPKRMHTPPRNTFDALAAG